MASELGADVVKVNFPHPEKRVAVKHEYDRGFSSQQAIDAVVRSANRTLVLVSGGFVEELKEILAKYPSS